MAKPIQLPLEGVTSDGQAVAIRERDLGFLTQLAGWDRFEASADAALSVHSLALPRDYRRPARTDAAIVWRIAPDKALVLSDQALGLDGSDDLVLLDLSDARIGLVLEGPGAAALLSRVMALDFSPTAFPADSFAQGALHHIGILVDRGAAERFELLVPTTWATSLIALLADHLR